MFLNIVQGERKLTYASHIQLCNLLQVSDVLLKGVLRTVEHFFFKDRFITFLLMD